MVTVDEEIGKRLREYRNKSHLTQGQIADAIGISADYYGRIERGSMEPTFKVLASIRKIFGWDMDYVLTGERSPDSPFLSFFQKCPEGCRKELTDAVIWVLTVGVTKVMDTMNDRKHHDKDTFLIEIAKRGKEFSNKKIHGIYESLPLQYNQPSYPCMIGAQQLFDAGVVYDLRESIKIDKNIMAQHMGLTTRRYRNIESGKSLPDVLMIVSIYEAYHINPNYLMTGKIEDMSELTRMWNQWPKLVQDYAYNMIQLGYEYLLWKRKPDDDKIKRF